MLKANDILAAIRMRVAEYERILAVNTGTTEADKQYNSALSMVVEDLKELLTDNDHAHHNDIAVIRCLHVAH